jgi:Fic family protein
MSERKSDAEIPALIDDPTELAEKEAENALAQFDYAMAEVERWLSEKKPNLRVSTLLTLHRHALEGIHPFSGNFRPAGVAIKGSKHEPISGYDVPRHVEEMLDYLTTNWDKSTAIHLSSYAMWRLNWIHPFADGNGRTSRILSYMVLCEKLGKVLPGVKTIPEQISQNKEPYYKALESADNAYKLGSIDVSQMEGLMEQYLANQLISVQETAIGHKLTTESSTLSLPEQKNESKNKLVSLIESHPVIFTTVAVSLAALITGFMS